MRAIFVERNNISSPRSENITCGKLILIVSLTISFTIRAKNAISLDALIAVCSL